MQGTLLHTQPRALSNQDIWRFANQDQESTSSKHRKGGSCDKPVRQFALKKKKTWKRHRVGGHRDAKNDL